MNEQTKRERVIKGLECCMHPEPMTTVDQRCPYFEDCQMQCDPDQHQREMMEDALSLLKKPEAHIMTIHEVKRLRKNDFVWVETPGRLGCYQVELSRTDIRVFECKLYSEYLLCHYMKRWGGFRCWTEKPTDKQRKAVKWIE